ncbi:MAG: zinc-binding dehydrogenase [Dehalococcoidia bacterium]
MKATYINQQGDVDVLTYGELPEPSAGAGEVLVRVRATALNHLDIFARSGRNRVVIDRFPHILGSDIAGEVAEVGPGVQGLGKGERVLMDYSIRCGVCDRCLAGHDELCTDSRSIGVDIDGGYAQYVSVPATNVHPIPDSPPFEEAAAIPLVFKTVWSCLITRCQLKPGEDVLVMAAGSGVGSAAIRLAKIMGARVITTASTDEKLAKARALGADETINYAAEPNYSKKVRELTDGKGVDLIFDSIGGSVWDENFECLKQGGRLVNCGVTGGHRASLRIGQMFTRGLTLMGASNGSKADFADVMKLVRQGQIRGIISQTFPLEAAAEAHRAMESRNVFGKLVLQIP